MNATFAMVLLAVVGLTACSGASVRVRVADELPALRENGYRVAVMPFAVSAPDEGLLESSLAPVGQLFALELGGDGLPARAAIGTVLRSGVVTWLSQGPFEVVETWTSDTALAHDGLDVAAMNDRGRAPEVARRLGVDGVLYGDVLSWNRSYYVLQSVAEVGLRMELVDGSSGRSLFLTERTESVGAGLSGGPTGILSAATEPIAGLRASTLQELTRAVARNAVLDLRGAEPTEAAAAGAAPPPPPMPVPRLSFLALARPRPGPFRAGDRIEVVALASPDCEVRFDLGRWRLDIPMVAAARHADVRGERVTYTGHYVVQPGDRAEGLPLTCTIRRHGAGRVSATHYRWDGTVDVDGSAPLTAASASGG